MPFGGRSERYELNGTGQLQRDRTYGSIVRDRTYGSIGSYSNPDPEAHRNFINDDDLDFQYFSLNKRDFHEQELLQKKRTIRMKIAFGVGKLLCAAWAIQRMNE
ncbi:hypothetical protein E2C01_025313 [Portunus trituberculatus]|uniref:Uncharacterized protein n=1 Tax=Portunus trituberculatus TaxID=210409 RepID=A0A5B7ECY4_PORTR|nr:hypothetical protein [Portunus trituberculatus]